jgi:protein-L-isoaspartate(D-aspartate) O-methyltransferase
MSFNPRVTGMIHYSRLGSFLHRAVLPGLLLLFCAAPWAQDDYQHQRERLVAEVARDVAETRGYTGRHALDERVMQVMGTLGRHRFVPPRLQSQAYANRPLPIGYGQTISQPYIVALMTDMLEPEEGDVVLEIGTGSGYQAAVLSRLVKRVYTIEIIPELAESATQRLARLGFDNIEVRNADGYYGWEEHAPFDAIIVTAASSHIPPPLVSQLKPGGVLMIPVGAAFQVQQLTLVKKDTTGAVSARQVLPVRFVPFTGKH